MPPRALQHMILSPAPRTLAGAFYFNTPLIGLCVLAVAVVYCVVNRVVYVHLVSGR